MLTGGARAHADDERTVVLERPGELRGSDDVGLFAALRPALFCVDGNNLLWRAAHSRPAPFPARDGRDLTPVFRFFSMLRRAIGTHGVFAECVVCFDGAAAWGSRLRIDPTYKANRRYEDVDLGFMRWLPEIRAALDATGVPCVEMHDHEADDVIATLAARAGGRAVRILSTDRDYYQLLDGATAVVNPRGRPSFVSSEVVREQYGVSPRQWCDFRALAGDPSDGIPGVESVGPKRAAALLEGELALGDLEASGRLDDPEWEPVRRRWDDVLRWAELVRLRTDVPVPLELRAAPTPRLPSPTAVCRELGLL